ncbi:hypothetical protein AB0J82_12645 [Asanoa sp. NPDC049518]|uniref:hypothetical protein n=1 Tax=unclassified Asanoa TaxID=2685164 RepID=UPI00341D61B9
MTTTPTPVRTDADYFPDACRLGELIAGIRVWVETLDEYPQYFTAADAMEQVRLLLYRHDANDASSTKEERR